MSMQCSWQCLLSSADGNDSSNSVTVEVSDACNQDSQEHACAVQFDSLCACTTLDKKQKNHHRDSRREERCSRCDIMLDQARSAQGKRDPRLLPCADCA